MFNKVLRVRFEMRRLVASIVTAGVLSVAGAAGANAAPVPGYEGLYNTVYTSCTLPDGTLAACETAINAYAGALVSSVALEAANQSFTELRQEVYAANAPDPQFRADIDALFELLLPDSGAIGGGTGAVGDDGPPAADNGTGGPVPASPF
jgi:hypothetical protein